MVSAEKIYRDNIKEYNNIDEYEFKVSTSRFYRIIKALVLKTILNNDSKT